MMSIVVFRSNGMNIGPLDGRQGGNAFIQDRRANNDSRRERSRTRNYIGDLDNDP